MENNKGLYVGYRDFTMKEIIGTELLREAGIGISTYQPSPRDLKIANDCTTRAMSKLLGLTWEEVFKKQCEVGADMYTMPNYIKVVEGVLKDYGYTRVLAPIYIPVSYFMLRHKTGSFLISSSKHIIAYIDGVIYDKHFNYFDSFVSSKHFNIFCKDEMADEIKNEFKEVKEKIITDDESRNINIYDDNKSLIRYRFKTKSVDDYRPLVDLKDLQMPWWCTGISGDSSYANIICYLPKNEDLFKYWDDAYDIESEEVTEISYNDRFPKPDWI